MTKRELELEVARLRGQIEAMQAEIHRLHHVPMVTFPNTQAPYYAPNTVWCGPIGQKTDG